jgi:hypothetical protein
MGDSPFQFFKKSPPIIGIIEAMAMQMTNQVKK